MKDLQPSEDFLESFKKARNIKGQDFNFGDMQMQRKILQKRRAASGSPQNV